MIQERALHEKQFTEAIAPSTKAPDNKQL